MQSSSLLVLLFKLHNGPVKLKVRSQCVHELCSKRVLGSLPVKCIFLDIETFNLFCCLFQALLQALSLLAVALDILYVSKCIKFLELFLIALQF